MSVPGIGVAEAVGLIGGVGLFLLGMWLMSDGLRIAGGDRLRIVLGQWTSSRRRAFVSGFFVTALVQSSSAVTVAVIGFVNAGLFTLSQAVWVVFGSNLGTTVTSWLVALVGVKFNVDLLALPLIGAGMILRLLSGESSRRAALGQAIAGFGLFFLGIEVLQTTFAMQDRAVDLQAWTGEGTVALLAFVVLGAVLTVLTQSSSAAIAIVLTAAAGGALSLPLAAAAVIGSNIGTTSTALFAAIGATPNAKRVAASHIVFNAVAAAAALALLPLMLRGVGELGHVIDPAGSPATVLAIFHTAFKLIGIAVMWPLSGWLVPFLEARFRSAEEDLAAPRHLDATLLAVPELSLAGVEREIQHLGKLSGVAVRKALSGGPFSAERRAAITLAGRIRAHVAAMNAASMPATVAAALPDLLRAIQHYEEIAERIGCSLTPVAVPPDLEAGERRLRTLVAEAVTAANTSAEDYDLARAQALWSEAESAYEATKARLLQAAATGSLQVQAMDLALDADGNLRRIAERAVKAAARLAPGAKAAEKNSDDPQTS